MLELAAKAAGRCIVNWIGDGNWVSVAVLDDGSRWQPLHENQFTDCMGDALRLAVNLMLNVDLAYGEECVVRVFNDTHFFSESTTQDPYAATRRAIFRAAAGIGKEMP